MAKYIRVDKTRLTAELQSASKGSCLMEINILPPTCHDEIDTAYVMTLLEDVVAYESVELMRIIHDDGVIPTSVNIDNTVYFVANTPEETILSNAVWGDGTTKEAVDDYVTVKSPFEQYKWYHYIIVGWLVGTMIYMTIRKYRRQKQSRIQQEYLMRQYQDGGNQHGFGMDIEDDAMMDNRRYSMSMQKGQPMTDDGMLGGDFHQHATVKDDDRDSQMKPRRNSMPNVRSSPVYDGRRRDSVGERPAGSVGNGEQGQQSQAGNPRRRDSMGSIGDRRDSIGKRRGSLGMFEQKSTLGNTKNGDLNVRESRHSSQARQYRPRRGSRGDTRPGSQQGGRGRAAPVRNQTEQKSKKKSGPQTKDQRYKRRGSGTGLSMMGGGQKKKGGRRNSNSNSLGLRVNTNTHRRPSIL
jgi:hypothetical protein